MLYKQESKKIYVIKNCKYYGRYFHCDTVCVVNNGKLPAVITSLDSTLYKCL